MKKTASTELFNHIRSLQVQGRVANGDLLMITGNEEVILFNGERWFNLLDKNRTGEDLRATGAFYGPRELYFLS